MKTATIFELQARVDALEKRPAPLTVARVKEIIASVTADTIAAELKPLAAQAARETLVKTFPGYLLNKPANPPQT
jgi:hypothetical protein